MKYVNKAVIVEAVEFFGFNKTNGRAIFSGRPDWLVSEFGKKIIFTENPNTVIIRNTEHDTVVNIGEYIIKGVKGEIYTCAPDIFEANYEIV